MSRRRAPMLVWDGLEEYRTALRALPEACLGEAAHLIEGEAKGAFVTISSVYGAHRFTGTLQDRLSLSELNESGPMLTGLVLASRSPIAWLFDNGSQARHWASGKSTGRMWGRTPPTHIFTRTVGQARRKLAAQFRELLLRHGATSVTG